MPKFVNDRFLRNNLIVFSGSLVISVLSYIYYPVLARIMPLSGFGEVQTLVSIFTQASLIFSALNIVIVVLVSSSGKAKDHHFILELQKLMVYLVAVFGLIAVIFSPLLKNFFNFHSVWPFIIMVLALLVNVPIVFWNSYLQGRENFTGMNWLGILGAFNKLFFSVVLVVLGLGTAGAVLGLVLGQLATMLYVGRRYELPNLRQLLDGRLPKYNVLQKELKYTGLVLLVTFMVTFLYSGDILIVKHYQSPELAGAYAGIASIARIVFFLTLPFAVVLLPAIHTGWQGRTKTLKRSFRLVVILGTATVLFFTVASNEIVRLLIGRRYEIYAHLLPKLSLAILFISISNLLFYYLLSLRKLSSLAVSSIGLASFLILCHMRHSSLDVIVDNLLIATAITLLSLLIVMSVWPRISPASLRQSFGES